MLHWRTNILGNSAALKKAVIVGDRVAGNIGSWDAEGRRLVGYWIGRDCWGRGIASAALSAFLREETRRPLCAYVAAHNMASIRVLQKCGFHQLGRVRHAGDACVQFTPGAE